MPINKATCYFKVNLGVLLMRKIVILSVLLVVISAMVGCGKDNTFEESDIIKSKINNYENYYLY